MVEPFKELNRLCQKPNYKTEGNWYVRTILRDAALPVTWLLLHTRITANQVTLISLVVSFVGMVLLAVPGAWTFLAGAVLLQFWYYLDHVDGQIARYRKTACLTGRFLDFMTHHIVHTALFFAMGFYGYAVTGSIFFVVWGFVASLAILTFNVTHDVKYKTFFERLLAQGNLSATIRRTDPSSGGRGEISQHRSHTSGVEKAGVREGKASLPKRIFSLLHKLCEIHVMMNILTLAAFIQFFTTGIDLRLVLFIVYGLMTPSIVWVKLFHILKNKKIGQEYSQEFGF